MALFAAALTSLALVAGSGGVAHAVNPETAPRKPNQDAGHYLGYPTPTYQWHKCTKTSNRKTPTKPPAVAGMPAFPRGTKQAAVKWTVVSSAAADSGWVVRWEAAKGWKICGVQVAVRGSNPKVDADLVMMAGYKSGGAQGATVKSGAETVRVSISKHEASMGGLQALYGGKTYKIEDIYGIAVFVKKK